MADELEENPPQAAVLLLFMLVVAVAIRIIVFAVFVSI